MINEGMANANRDEYKATSRSFNPKEFDAMKIAQLAKDAGMKYIIITSKHHDGFAMYHSACDKFNIVDATPFDRDPMKELADACKKLGLGFGFYYSHNQDWTTPGGFWCTESRMLQGIRRRLKITSTPSVYLRSKRLRRIMATSS